MLDLYLTVRSVTPGQKGSEALSRAGIRNRLLRAPRAIAPGGCAYALTVSAAHGTRALAVLDRAGVSVSGVWRRDPEGAFARAAL